VPREESQSRVGDFSAFIIEQHVATLHQRIGDRNAERAREMIVASACALHRRVNPWRNDRGWRRGDRRNSHDPFQHLRDERRGKPVVAMPSLLHGRQQLLAGHLQQVEARSLRCHAGRAGELKRRERPPIHERSQHRGARWIPNQLSDIGNSWIHDEYLTGSA
jgi:hypothetical protein